MSKFSWLKLWNDAPDDPKFIAAADIAGSTPANAWYAWSKSLTYANGNDPRGSITGLHPQVIASYCRITVEEVKRIFQAFRELRMLIGDRIAKWAKRQTDKVAAKVRSAGAERQARHRAKLAAAAAQGELELGAATPVTPAQGALLSSVTFAAEEEVDNSEPVGSESIGHPTSPEFEEFWARYPRKVGKGAARKAYAGARRIAPWPEIMAGVLRYAAESTDRQPRFVKHPATWLNAECWNDEPEPVPVMTEGNSRGHRPRNRFEDFSGIIAGLEWHEANQAARIAA